MFKSLGKFNWRLIPVYLLLAGGLISLTVFLAVEVDEALALTLLFTALGTVAYAFVVREEGPLWAIVAAINWLAALIALTVYVVEAHWMDVTLAIAALFFLAAGGLYYLLALRPTARRREPTPAERDVPTPR